MRIRISIIVSLFMLTTLGGLAHGENLLKGRVYENHGDTKKLAIGAQIWIVHIGNPYTTGPDGAYQVLVPDAIRFGQTIELYVKRRGWAIATPVGGKVELSKELTTDIVLSPEASSEFLSPAQLDKLLESLPEKLKGQIKPDGKEGEADPTQVVKEYATEHGLPAEEVLPRVAELVKQYQQSPDSSKQCLAALYQKDLKQAATRCEQSAIGKVDVLKKKRQEVESLSKSQLKSDHFDGPSFAHQFGDIIRVSAPSKPFRLDTEPQDRRDRLFVGAPSGKATPAELEEAKRQLIKLTEEVVGEFKSTGDTYYANYQFDKALSSYKEGLSYVEKKDLPTLWANMQWQIGLVNGQIGIRTEGAAIQEHLNEAVSRYQEAQSVYTRKDFPQAYAALQNNLGNVLGDQGTRTGGEEGRQLLAQAVTAYRAALEVRTRELLPQDWAMTQNNLGTALNEQGTRTGGEEGRQLLTQAVTAYRAALEIRTKEHLPEGWAQTHNNLAKAAVVLEDWRTAAESYRNVLMLYPDYTEVYQSANAVYHDKLFVYPSAFELSKQWLERHPNDLSAQANFAEANFTTGRYTDAASRLGELLKKPDVDPSSKVGLRILDIVTALALKKANLAPQNLQDLRTFISTQPESFHAEWSFDGTKHYVQTEEVFAPYRAWLMELFSVVKAENRAALLVALDHVQASFQP